ncbi:MAG TPA: glycosyltransferase family 87 protein [Candidatus Limnocylindrales bacterium]|nr:glycosyltransferase family 87 protein [Candidatus Limnocylindrales bacterium]
MSTSDRASARRAWLRRTVSHAAVLAGLIFCAYLVFVAAPVKGSLGFDVAAYWSVDLAAPYHGSVGDHGFFAYSPAIALLLAPLTQLPWPVFLGLWYALLVGALVFLGRRSTLLLLAFPPVAIDLYHGNIHLLLACAVVIGFRYPQAWALVLLTKVTPGIGLLWFAVRREWRQLGLALGATAAIVAITAVLLPTQWLSWFAMLAASAGVEPPWPALPVPIWLRLPIAAAIVVWGARRDARWTVAVAAAISVPALWPGAFAILAAVWPLRRSQEAHSGQEAATARPEDRGYHAADAGQRGRPEPVSA